MKGKEERRERKNEGRTAAAFGTSYSGGFCSFYLFKRPAAGGGIVVVMEEGRNVLM